MTLSCSIGCAGRLSRADNREIALQRLRWRHNGATAIDEPARQAMYTSPLLCAERSQRRRSHHGVYKRVQRIRKVGVLFRRSDTFSYEERAAHYEALASRTLERLSLSERPNICFHYSARFSREDREAILGCAKRVGPHGVYFFVWINSHHNVRLYDSRPNTDGNLARGSMSSAPGIRSMSRRPAGTRIAKRSEPHGCWRSMSE